MWSDIASLVRKGNRFLLTTHINPDGDGIGSELALYRYLRFEGKEIRILNANHTPKHYDFLDQEGAIEVFTGDENQLEAFDCDSIFILDISTVQRLGPLGDHVMSSKAKKICIDHHQSNNRFADVNVIDTGACATGELIYDLIMFMRGWLDCSIALPLYVSIMTDTGTYRFSNTNARTHEITAWLVTAGVNPRKVYERIYENNSPGHIRLLARILDTLQVTEDGRIAWISVKQDVFRETGSKPEDLEGMIDYLRMIGGVEICVLFLERAAGGTKVSLRSKGVFDVNRFAANYGGGGHHHASGLVVDAPPEEAAPVIVTGLDRSLQDIPPYDINTDIETCVEKDDGASGTQGTRS